MKKAASLIIYLKNQPDEIARARVREVVDAWNAAHPTRWTLEEAGPYTNYFIRFEDTSTDEFAEFDQDLAEAEDRYALVVEQHLVTHYDDADRHAADMVLLYGVELDGLPERYPAGEDHPRFVVNLGDNWAPGTPCPGCGWEEPVYGRQLGPFVIDEFFLDHEPDPDTGAWRPISPGWDLISIPGGVLLASERVIALFREHRVRGFRTKEVRSSATGTASSRVAQLEPDRWLTQVCAEHSEIEGEICPSCGRVLGEMFGERHLDEAWTGGDEVVGTVAGPRLVYFGQRVFRLLERLPARGMIPSVPLSFCHHGRLARLEHGKGPSS